MKTNKKTLTKVHEALDELMLGNYSSARKKLDYIIANAEVVDENDLSSDVGESVCPDCKSIEWQQFKRYKRCHSCGFSFDWQTVL